MVGEIRVTHSKFFFSSLIAVDVAIEQGCDTDLVSIYMSVECSC